LPRSVRAGGSYFFEFRVLGRFGGATQSCCERLAMAFDLAQNLVAACFGARYLAIDAL
jgi:hypothetical protein